MLLAELCLAGNACSALTPTQSGSSPAKEQLSEQREWCQDALERGKGKEKVHRITEWLGLEGTMGTDSLWCPNK